MDFAHIPSIDGAINRLNSVSFVDSLLHDNLAAASGVFGRTYQYSYGIPVDAGTSPRGRDLCIAAWNLERGRSIDKSFELIRQVDPDVLIATELDIGMARSGNKNVVHDLARKLSMNAVFAVEFVEGGHGTGWEHDQFAGARNRVGLHATAIFSKLPILHAEWITDSSWGLWRSVSWHSRRLGGRGSLRVNLKHRGLPLSVLGVHLESEFDAASRAGQMREYFDHLSNLSNVAVIGGDLNTRSTGASIVGGGDDWFSELGSTEPVMCNLAREGFEWVHSNDPVPTRRTMASGFPRPPLGRDDWLLSRGISVVSKMTVPATFSGEVLSDHDLVAAVYALDT